MIGVLIIGVIIAVAYPLFLICGKKIIPVSLTQSYELLGSKGWMFQGYIALVALTILPSWVLISEDNPLLCIVAICAMLMAANKIEGKIHLVSAITSFISALIWLINEGNLGVLVAFSILFLIMNTIKKAPIFWGELAIIYSIITQNIVTILH